MKSLTPESLAALFGCTPDQVRRQFAKNAAHIRQVIAKLKSGARLPSYTLADVPMLEASADNYERQAGLK